MSELHKYISTSTGDGNCWTLYLGDVTGGDVATLRGCTSLKAPTLHTYALAVRTFILRSQSSCIHSTQVFLPVPEKCMRTQHLNQDRALPFVWYLLIYHVQLGIVAPPCRYDMYVLEGLYL